MGAGAQPTPRAVAGVSLPQKLKMVAKYSPVFALTTFFRVGCLTSTTIAAGFSSNGYGVNAFASGISFATPLVFAVPLIVLLLCKSLPRCCASGARLPRLG